MFSTNIDEKFALPLKQSVSIALIISVVFLAVCAIISIGGNLLVLLVYLKRVLHQRARPPDYIIVNLAISDFIVGLIIIPLMITTDIFILCRQVLFLRAVLESVLIPFLSSVSIWTVLGASIDRFLAIKRPYHYKSIVNPSRVNKWLLFTWTYASTWIWFPFLPGQFICHRKLPRPWRLIREYFALICIKLNFCYKFQLCLSIYCTFKLCCCWKQCHDYSVFVFGVYFG